MYMPVLDYSECFEVVANEFGLSSVPSRPLLLSELGFCPYCKIEAAVVHNTGNRDAEPDMYEGYDSPRNDTWYAKAWLCQCGWWEVESIQKHTMDVLNSVRFQIEQASLRRFNPSSADAPTTALRSYLVKNPKSLNYLNPRRMELLTQSVFSDFYNCEAVHCGRSHDKGVDLILVDSDSPIAVQVKRRGENSPAEAVSVVREFLGAFLLEGFRKGVLVTTAYDFSSEAWKAAKRAVTKDFVDSFELVNREEFLQRLKLVADGEQSYWKEYVDFSKQDSWGI